MLALIASSFAAVSSSQIPTARELYVGCYLLVQGKDVPEAKGAAPDPYSAASCLMVVGIGAEHEAAKPEAERTFCLPSIIAANPYRDMALAYLDFYEATGGKLAAKNSIEVASAAFAAKWPCRR
jgi:hypothetical protein